MLKYWRKCKYAIDRRISNVSISWHKMFLRTTLSQDISKQLFDDQLIDMDNIPKDPTADDIWNRLLLLPWDSTWNMLLLMTIFLTTSIYLPLLTAIAIMFNQKQQILLFVYTGELMYTTDIILYIIARRNPFLYKPIVSSVNRPVCILLIDIISVLPVHVFGGPTTLYNSLSLIHCLKFVRIQYQLHYIEKMLFYPNYILWFEIIFWLGCTLAFGSLIAVVIECTVEDKCSTDIFTIIYSVVHHVTSAGYYQVPDNTTWSYVKLIMGLPFVMVTVFLAISTRAQHIYGCGCRLCYLMTIFQYLILSVCFKKKMLSYQYDVTKQILDNISSSPFVTSMYNSCYETIWRMCNGYSGYLADTLLPYSPHLYKKLITPMLWMNIMEDITVNFFQHSMLFTNMDRSFLRVIATEIKCLVYSKGQLLYIKNELADKMIYIVSGLVQVLSSEDEETSVLDMISGTCLGEASLMFPKVAVSTIRCATDCEIQVLMSTSYFTICKKYSQQHRILHKIILDRIKEGKAFKQVADLARKDQPYCILDMMWMNHTLHRLAGAANRIQARRHQMQNIHLRSFYTEEELTKIPRMIKYLRLINIAARTLEMEKMVFLRTTWPFIIHPDGIMRKLLEIIIVTLSLAVVLAIPYMCFICTNNTGIEIMQYLISAIWVTDLWIQMHTAVKTEEGLIMEPKQILRYRLTTIDFIIDILSCLPLELTTIFFVSKNKYPHFQINRAAKIWRIHRMFQHLENNFRLSIPVVRVVKILCLLIYAIYVSACLMYSVPCPACDHSFFYALLPVAVQICTGISLQTNLVSEYAVIYFPMMIFSWFVRNAYIAHMIVFFKNRRLMIYKTQQRVESFQAQIPKHRKDILRNLKNFVEAQDQHGQNVTFICKQQFLDNLTRQQMRIISEIHIGPTLRSCPLFADLGDDNILEICSLTQWRVKPAGHVILHCGDVHNYLIILLEGICEVVNGQTGKNIGLKSGCALNDLEVLLEEPLCQTIVTVTSCRLIILKVAKLKRMFELFPPGQKLKQTLDSCTDIKAKMQQLPRNHIPLSKFKYFTRHKEKLFYNINENKKTRLFYMRHFLQLNFFSFTRFLLMTITIRPNDKLIFHWEVFRSVCAALSVVTYININFICDESTNKMQYSLLWFLDLACYADIYIRLHVGYYNKQGILIQHPLFTARNYIYGPFILDFLASIPFRFVMYLNSAPTGLMVCHLFKVYQLNRYFMLIYVKAKSVKAKIFFFVIPTCILTLNVVANCAIIIMCDVNDCRKWPRNLTCLQYSKISQDLVDDGHLYLYSIYVVTSIMTTTGLQGVHFLQRYVFFWILNVISLLLYAVFTGFIVSIYYSYDKNFLEYKKLIGNLRNFMRHEDVPQILQSVFLDYYQRCWDIRKGQKMDVVMQPFSMTLRRDVLYEKFGTKILSFWVFESNEAISFIKRILLYMSQLLILPGHDVLEISDVTPFIYIIISGTVIVKDEEDGIEMILTEGSLFGNLSDGPYSRMDNTYTASDVLELLYIPAPKFLKYLKRFPSCYNVYKDYKENVKDLTYIKAYKSEMDLRESKDTIRIIRYSVIRMLYIALNVCTFGSILHILLYFYQVSVRYKEGYLTVIMYISDVLYATLFLLVYFLEKHTVFKVTYGFFQKGHTFLNLLFFLSLLPFEIFAYHFLTSKHFFHIYITLKVIKPLRVMHVYYVYNSYLLLFSEHMAMLRMCAIVTLYSLMILFCTAVLSLSSQFFQPNLNLHIDPGLLDGLVGYQKFDFFIKLLSYVSNIVLRITNIEQQPLSFLHIVILIVIMVFIRLVIVIGTAEISWIVYDMNLPKLVYKNKVMNLLSFLKRWQCSEEVMETVQNSLEINWYTTKGEGLPLLFMNAPRFLKRLVAAHCYLKYIKNHAVFGKCPVHFQRQLVLHFKLEMYEHGKYILLAGTYNSTMYWVHRGHVLQIFEDDENILSKGACFAYQEGSSEFNNPSFPVSYKALTQVQIMSLERSSWIHLLDYFPEAKDILAESHSGSTSDFVKKMYY